MRWDGLCFLALLPKRQEWLNMAQKPYRQRVLQLEERIAEMTELYDSTVDRFIMTAGKAETQAAHEVLVIRDRVATLAISLGRCVQMRMASSTKRRKVKSRAVISSRVRNHHPVTGGLSKKDRAIEEKYARAKGRSEKKAGRGRSQKT